MKKTKIIMANTIQLSISGGEEKAVLREKYENICETAEAFDGTILREEEFNDGFFIEFIFPTEEILKSFRRTIGLK